MGYIGIPNLNIVDTITDETPRNAIPSVSAIEGLAGEATNLDAAVRYVDNIPTDETELQELKDSLVDGAYVHAINENPSGDGTSGTSADLSAAVRYVDVLPTDETELDTLMDSLVDGAYVHATEEVGSSDGTNNVSPRNLGEIVYSPLPLADASLHLADGSLIDSNSPYASAVTNLTTLYNAMPDAPCWATEEAWQAELTQYGACAKWVVNTEAGTIRIPNLTGFIEGTVNEEELGRLVEAGLPNINAFVDTGIHLANATGSFTTGSSGNRPTTSQSGANSLSFDASSSSPIYGNSETVQPQAMRVYVYVCLLPGLSTAATDIKQDVANVVKAVERQITVVETGRSEDGTAWYRKWSDGWIEQGGFLQGSYGSTVTIPIILPTPFTGTDYNVQITGYGTRTAGDNLANVVVGYISKTETTINAATRRISEGENLRGLSWQACGY